MAGTRISDGTPTSLTGAEKVPMGNGAGKTVTNIQSIADFSRISSTNIQAASYVPVLSDVGNYIDYNSASAGNITINDIGTTAWKSGSILTIRQKSTGAFTIVAGGTTTFINPSGTLVSQGQGSIVQLINIEGTSQWYVIGGGKSVPTLSDGVVPVYSNTLGNLSTSNITNAIATGFVGINNTSPNSWFDLKDNTLTNVAPTASQGLTLSNTTTSTAGGGSNSNKYSPGLFFLEHVFNTTSGTDNIGGWRIYSAPQTGASPDHQLTFGINLNGTFTDKFYAKANGLNDVGGKWFIINGTGFGSNSYSWASANTVIFTGNASVSGSTPLSQFTASGNLLQTTGTYGLVQHNMPLAPVSGTAIFYNTQLSGTINNAGSGTVYGIWGNQTITATGGDYVGFAHDPTVTTITGHNVAFKATSGQFQLPFTLTAVGTTGNQTINKISGSVRIAASGTTVTVTNNLVTANSIVFPMLATADTTAWIKNYTRTAGSFTINLGAAATAEVEITWFVINY